MKRIGLATGVVAVLLYFLCFNHTEPAEAGIAWNPISGELSAQAPGDSGWHLTAPWTRVARIDLRPQRVCITTAGRGVNCKLVQFQLDGLKAFVDAEGFRYYWWANRVSYNYGYSEEYRGFRDILRGYAFSAKQYPFIKVLEDYTEGG